MYLRPPHVTVATAIEPCDPNGPTPAHKNWRHANWLNWVSVVNKQDYARLQGFDFTVTALQVRRMLLGGPLICLECPRRYIARRRPTLPLCLAAPPWRNTP